MEVGKLLSHCCIKNYHGRGTVGARTYRAELEAVAGEGKRRCAVAVGIVESKLRNLGETERILCFFLKVGEVGGVAVGNLIEDIGELAAGED